jgi:hypothetical protein
VTILYRVETVSTGGMHKVVAITAPDRAADGDETLGDNEVALARSAVRGHLDLIGHETGPAVTLIRIDEGEAFVVSAE